MKKWLLLLLLSIAAVKLSAQTNAPVRLALIAESEEAMTVADVLTAQFSGNQKIQLLERDEIEKAYHEQGMSAANRDDLKLGRILGADGLLLLDIARTPGTTNLTVRLVAVRPGVVLTDGSFSWPLKDITQWADSVAAYLQSFLPKLTVLAKDAIPISVVNLRAAVSSADEQETERELKLLAIQRLSQERQFFVLERQRMQLLSGEKELKSEESAFWDGSYLLDGTVDQNGYSRDTVTINARLTPPKGGAPLSFVVNGSRTNLAEVVNRLAKNVTALLKVNSTVEEWNAPDEAAQYFDEAKWALRWGIYPEAQAAADSAWALGKKDLACDLVRIRAYISQVPEVVAPNLYYYQNQDDYRNQKMDPHYVHINEPPDPKYCDIASYALNCYYEFSRVSPDGEPRVLWKETAQARGLGWHDWHISDWYQLGIDSLTAASRVLQHFNYHPESQKPVADKLADLRAQARSVAELISRSPSVHDSFFVGDRIAARDELTYTISDESPKRSSIFDCEVEWGCFWQERPEDTIELYRTLMSSPVYSYIHENLWTRPVERPRLVAWNAADAKRIPAVWNNFLLELGDSTNIFLQLEAKAFQLADAKDDQQRATAFTNLFDGLISNREALVACKVEVLYLNWGTAALVNPKTDNGTVTDTRESLSRQFYSQYHPKLQAMDQEYWSQTVFREGAQAAGEKTKEAFGKQVEYLRNKTPYNWFEFNKVFESKNYTRAQATELLPLLAAYQSNLIARVKDKPASDQFKAKSDSNWIELYVGVQAKEVLHPSPPRMNSQVKLQAPRPYPPAEITDTASVATKMPGMATNILLVNRYLKIPVERIPAVAASAVHITGQRWSEGKLLVGLAYSREVSEFDQQSNTQFIRDAIFSAIAVFNPDDETWDIVNSFETSGPWFTGLVLQTENDRMVLFRGSLYWIEAGVIREFDFGNRQWRTLPVPRLEADQLFTVGEHLFATGRNTIFEITDEGRGTRILASTRRHPAESALDALNSLGFRPSLAGGAYLPPELFLSPDHSICANIGNKVFSWDGQDWHEVLNLNLSHPPDIIQDGIIFRSIPFRGSDDPACLWLWDKRQSTPELVLSDKPEPHPGLIDSPFRKPNHQSPRSIWESPDRDYLTRSPVAFFESNLYFFVEHAGVTNVNGHSAATEKDGYHARLVRVSRDSDKPIILPLKFDVTRGMPPLKSLSGRHEPWLALDPLLSAPIMYFWHNTLFLSQRNTPGVWAIPVSEIESAMETQKQIQLAELAENQNQPLTAQMYWKGSDTNVFHSLPQKYDDQAKPDPPPIQ